MPDDLTKVLANARSDLLTIEDCGLLASNRLTYELRNMVVVSDLTWILPNLLKYPDERSALMIALARNFTDRPEVQARLREAWNDANPFQRCHLLWRILDDPELPQDWHDQIFAFVQKNWSTFAATCLTFYDVNSADLAAGVVERYLSAERTRPLSKNWIYLCNLSLASGFPNTKRHFIETGAKAGTPMEKRVAEWLLEKTETD